MYHYFARVELLDHDVGDYEKLHQSMAEVGYYRVIQLKDGHWYDLPKGEYYKKPSFTIMIEERYMVEDAVLKIVRNDKDANKDYSLVLTRSYTTEIILKVNRTLDTTMLPPGENL